MDELNEKVSNIDKLIFLTQQIQSETGLNYCGELVNGQRHGLGKLYHSEQMWTYVGSFENGLIQGFG